MQTGPENLDQRVIQWIAEFLRVAPERVSGSSALNHDLGVDGDDGVELVHEFGRKFGVDVAKFPYGDYFGPEASNPLALVGALLRGAVRGGARDLRPLYVSDLVNLARGDDTAVRSGGQG